MRRVASALLLVALCGCGRHGGIPEPGSQNYRDLLSNFYVGLAALQAGEDVRAKQGLTLATQLAPGEPATFGNLAVLELRKQQYEAAAKDAETARTLAPDSSQVESLLGLIESKRGNLPQAIGHLQRAVSLDAGNDRARYQLAQEIERQGTAEDIRAARQQLRALLGRQPNNTAVLLDEVRLSAKLDDGAAVNSAVAKLGVLGTSWPAVAKRQLSALQAASAGNVRSAAVQVQFLRNVLVRDPAFRQSQDAVRSPAGTVGEPFLRFVRIPSPRSLPSPPDLPMTFARDAAGGAPTPGATWAGSLPLEAKADARLIWADTHALHTDSGATLPIPAPLTRHSVATGDLNYDFKSDLVIATAKGVRIFQQGLSPLFSDVTAKTKLPEEIVNGSYGGAWLFDIDLDGDLDIVLGATNGPPVVLRNNADGSYAVLRPFSGVGGVTEFATADIDSDGDPDVAMIGGDGQLHMFSNERLGNYRQRTGLALPRHLTGLAAADINGDGVLDFVVLAEDGTVLRISDGNSGANWKTETLFKADTGAAGLLLADLDNNGSTDAVVGNQVFLGDNTKLQPLPQRLAAPCQTIVDLNGDGQLDLVTVGSDESGLTRLLSRSTKHYGWQTVRTQASQTIGDQRINSFGMGGEIELRSGLLTQKQVITSPMTHFGLGDNASASLARIVWPNGALQVEFDLKRDTTALAQQRLKGSCPFLFAWDGKGMQFVKDCPPWSPALGLHVNAQKVAGIGQTEEWFKIPGAALQPRGGYYDLRITAEYWETFYIDHYSLLAVDHPGGTEVFTDERFAVPAPPLRLYATGQLHPFERAMDDRGNDVSATVASLDRHYLDTFGRGRYQGVTRDHWVELTVPADAPRSGPLYLIGSGWLHPTDATINVALGQSSDVAPHGLSIEVLGANGTWQVARADGGFPAGRLKNVVFDISHLFRPGCERRLRLRTNLEIYWDRLAWAPGIPEDQLQVQHLGLADATLDYRGFSRMRQANRSSPELPDYDEVAARGPRWRDLEGYYTRFGNVRPLLEKADDRMLITNAGDELRLRVKAPAQPRLGWVRDFVLVGDGWIKDGDYNCTFSRTVLPLPYHGLHEYDRAAGELEDDPAYRLHPEDWRDFHTRYVGPELFSRALWQ